MTGPATDDFHRAMNDMMTSRLLAGAGHPYTEGGHALRVLRTLGRTSRREHLHPVAVLQQGGELYLISPVAHRDRVRNLEFNGVADLVSGDGSEPVLSRRLTSDDAVAAIHGYLQAATGMAWATNRFPVPVDADHPMIAEKLGWMAAFRIDRVLPLD